MYVITNEINFGQSNNGTKLNNSSYIVSYVHEWRTESSLVVIHNENRRDTGWTEWFSFRFLISYIVFTIPVSSDSCAYLLETVKCIYRTTFDKLLEFYPDYVLWPQRIFNPWDIGKICSKWLSIYQWKWLFVKIAPRLHALFFYK